MTPVVPLPIPPISVVDPVEAAKKAITKIASGFGIDYDEMMAGAERYLMCGDYMIQGGRWEGMYLDDEFWIHYEIVTGEFVAQKDRGSFFSCSC